MEIVSTILPIFVVILLGWGARRLGYIPDGFLDPANRLVYSLSIPALIFGAIAKTSFHQNFNTTVLAVTMAVLLLTYVIAFGVALVSGMERGRQGAFVLSSAHSNVGYIGLPTAYYYLGPDDFAATGIICGFVMIAQNMLSVVFLQLRQLSSQSSAPGKTFKALATNPVIGGALAGMVVSLAGIELPAVVWRTVDILGDLAPPMALLLIGATLTMKLGGRSLIPALGGISIKLVFMPALAILFFHLFGLGPGEYLPALVLLCSPAATIVFVMVKNMGCDADFAVTQISLGTLLSALTFILWLGVLPLLAGG